MVNLQEDFFRELQFNKQYSENTISAYKRDISIYNDFCKTKKSLTEFYKYLTERKFSPKSQVRIISCVRMYLKFLQLRGHSVSEIKYLTFPKIEKKLPKLITIKDFNKLLECSYHKNKVITLRNHLVLHFLYGLGCRVSELVSLKVKDFNPTEGWVNVTGKGDRQRLLPLSKSLYALLMVYLKESRPSMIKPSVKSLFFNNKGKSPSRVDIWRWLKTWSYKAGFKDVKNPHAFRHGCATGLLEQGADLRSIQKLLGHLNIQTTQIYTSVTSKHLKETVDKYHPFSHSKPHSKD